MRFEQYIGKAVAIAIGADPAREHEDIGAAIGVKYCGLGLGSAPVDAIGQPEFARCRFELPQQRSPAEVNQAPMPIGREEGVGSDGATERRSDEVAQGAATVRERGGAPEGHEAVRQSGSQVNGKKSSEVGGKARGAGRLGRFANLKHT